LIRTPTDFGNSRRPESVNQNRALSFYYFFHVASGLCSREIKENSSDPGRYPLQKFMRHSSLLFPSRTMRFGVALLGALLTTAYLAAQSVSVAGLYGVDQGVSSTSANFVSVQMDSAKDLYLLLDEGDGVRVLKLNPAGTSLLDSIHLGAAGDHGAAMALNSSGNVYVAGVAGSGQLTASGSGAISFPSAQSSFVLGMCSALVRR
jgi:hypothetical protein